MNRSALLIYYGQFFLEQLPVAVSELKNVTRITKSHKASYVRYVVMLKTPSVSVYTEVQGIEPKQPSPHPNQTE